MIKETIRAILYAILNTVISFVISGVLAVISTITILIVMALGGLFFPYDPANSTRFVTVFGGIVVFILFLVPHFGLFISFYKFAQKTTKKLSSKADGLSYRKNMTIFWLVFLIIIGICFPFYWKWLDLKTLIEALGWIPA